MNAGVVVDASVALKLVLREDLSDEADALLRATLRRGAPLCVPPLARYEVTNALLQRVRRGLMTEEQAQSVLADLSRLRLLPTEPPRLHELALTFAMTNQIRSAYDTTYVTLARLLDVELWTADQNLLNALGDRAPWVRWIGDYPLQPEAGSPP
jgi:predicted nucleic acid-binding protein